MNNFLNYQDEFGIYIHSPFCRKKCSYCDFYSIESSKKTLNKYLKSLKAEIQFYSKLLDKKKVKTIYIGGGTPSLLSTDDIVLLLNQIKDNFNLKNNIEITMESNPDSLTEKKVIGFKNAGINRMSVGIQSFINKELNILGRVHNSKKSKNIIEILQKHISNYNVDLMFALPGQKFEDFQFSINKLIEYNPPHISLYNLQIEEGTLLYKQLKSGIIETIEEDLDYKMYNYAINELKKAGYNHYEISNFAKENYESKHNIIYWKYKPYLGLGPSAHGFNGYSRYYNVNSLSDYMSQLSNNEFPIDNIINLTKNELISERMIMGLRLIEGIDRDVFKDRFNCSIESIYHDEIRKLKNQGLLTEDKNKIYLTKKGINLGNKVFSEFLIY